MSATLLSERPGGVHLSVRVKPRAGKSRVICVRDGELEVAVAAPPVDGAANEELIKTVARFLEVKKSSVSVAGGATSRHKVLLLAGLGLSDVTRKFSQLGQGA